MSSYLIYVSYGNEWIASKCQNLAELVGVCLRPVSVEVSILGEILNVH